MIEKSKLSCSIDTENSISDAFKKLMSVKAFEKISVSDITDLCDIHRQTFYYHFSDKYELLNTVVYNELIMPLINDFKLDNMYEKLENLFATMKAEKGFYQSVFKIYAGELFNLISKLIAEEFVPVFQNIQHSSGIHVNDEAENKLFAEFFSYGIAGIACEWALDGMKEEPRIIVQRIFGIISSCKQLMQKRQ